MARKTAKALKPFPDLPWLVEKAKAFQALTNEEKQTILALDMEPPFDPLIRAVVSYVHADAAADKADAALDAVRLDDRRPNGLAKGYTEDDFNEALAASSRANNVLGRAVDTWKIVAFRARAEEVRRADPTQSNVPKEDAKTLIAEALSESAVELQWNVKSVGLVAHKLCEAVYGHVVREEAQEPPLCEACR